MPIKVEWTPALGTGLPEVDDQHKELFRRANLLFAACVTGNATEHIANVLAYLADHVREHFASEELLMESTGFPGRYAHVRTHRGLTGELNRLARKLEDHGAGKDLLILINRFLIRSLLDHVATEDLAHAEHVRVTAKATPRAT